MAITMNRLNLMRNWGQVYQGGDPIPSAKTKYLIMSCHVLGRLGITTFASQDMQIGRCQAMFDIITEGGIFMWPLLFGSALAVGAGLERAFYFLKLKSAGRDYRESLERALASGDLDKAASLSQGEGPAQACAKAAVENWAQGLEVVEAAMSAQAKEYEPELHRHLGLLETIVTAAPLIGLLGTITGMMGVFRSVSQKLGSDPHANTTGITAGIGEALIATATGILVAVLALLIHNICQSQAESRMTETEQTAEGIRLAYVKQSR